MTDPTPDETIPVPPTAVGAGGEDLRRAGRRRRPSGRRWEAFWSNRLAVTALVVLCLIVLAALLAPWVAGYGYEVTDLRARSLMPGSPGHVLGTDHLGRDIWGRLVYATQVSLAAGLGSVLMALVVALPLGMAAGYFGGLIDRVASAVVDFLLSFPPVILVFVLAGILGASLRNAIIALGVYFTPLFVRLIRGEVRTMRQGQLVEAERAVGASDLTILRRHVLPNIASPIIVQASLTVGVGILAEAALSFLGLGVQPPRPSWGIMIRTAFDRVQSEPWMIVIPATAVALTVLCLNIVGDGLRDALGRLEG